MPLPVSPQQKHIEVERTSKWLKMMKSWDKYKNSEKVRSLSSSLTISPPSCSLLKYLIPTFLMSNITFHILLLHSSCLASLLLFGEQILVSLSLKSIYRGPVSVMAVFVSAWVWGLLYDRCWTLGHSVLTSFSCTLRWFQRELEICL